MIELRRLVAGALLQHDHLPAGARQLGGDDAATRARPDDADVRFELRGSIDVRERERPLAGRAVRRRQVADAVPGRIGAPLVHQRVKQE